MLQFVHVIPEPSGGIQYSRDWQYNNTVVLGTIQFTELPNSTALQSLY
jgi:hypothetical protein